jgi:hypothetical protein
MAKVDELREKYPRVTKATFEKLVKADTTPTKKYLEYMLKMWTTKLEGKAYIPTSNILIDQVKLFDELLPYNNNSKDIYSREYSNFEVLKNVNNKLSSIREEKTFNKNEHANIIFEDDNYIFLEPKTHKGSLKYGANTRWCTASKANPNTFASYTKRSCLVYLIDKQNSKGNASKLAFYNNDAPLTGEITIYNQNDSNVTESYLISYGWSIQTITEFILKYRLYHVEWKQIKNSRDEVNKVISVMKTLDLNSLSRNMEILKSTGSNEFEGVKTVIDDFVKKIENNITKLKI